MARTTWRWLWLVLLAMGLSGCPDDDPGPLERIQARGELRLGTRNAPTTYYIDRQGRPAGPEWEMVRDFARRLGVTPRPVVKDSLGDLFQALDSGEVDLLAAGITHTPARARRYLFGPTYQRVRQQVVCRRGGPRPRSPSELASVRLVVPSRSSYVEHLARLAQTVPGLVWQEDSEEDSEGLLAQVWRREIDCTVADSNIVAINRRYYPELVVAFDLSEDQALAWVMPLGGADLQAEVIRWFDHFRALGALDTVMERYYGHVTVFDYVDVKRFLARVRTRLPRYRPWFEAAGEKYGLPWTLLAAQAYQESHWNRRARSPTGVRGIMMLTLATARELGIRSRLDARASIDGGARYLARLRDRLPEEIPEPDRTWMALAAYNMGYGHLQDAWTLARRLGKDPYRWHELQTVLPLLAKKRYYRSLKYGYARGWEPVIYVQRIRNFQDLLERHLAEADCPGQGLSCAGSG